MRTIVDFDKSLLIYKGNLMCQNVVCSGAPDDRKGVISRYPFGTDISIDLDRVRFSIIGRRRDCVVGQGKGLVDEISRLWE